jgi:hypothetical protein
MWHTARSGRRVWRLTVQSPGAAALKLHIQSGMQQGRIWVYAEDGAVKSGAAPYPASGPFGDGDFWTRMEKGERLTVEVTADSEVPGQPLVVTEVAHFEPVRMNEAQKTRPATPICSPDTGIPAEPWRAIGASVGLMLFQTENGSWATCTGTMLNDRQGTRSPLFLTAYQCISTAQRARSLEVFFRFEMSAGWGSFNPLVDLPRDYPFQSIGARILASASVSEGDASLLQLTGNVPSVAFAGWNGTDLPVGAEVRTIHHPAGTYTHLLVGNIVGVAVPPTVVGGLARTGPSDYFQMVYHGSNGMEEGSVGASMFRSDGIAYGTVSKASCWEVSKYSRFGTFLPRVQKYLNTPSNASCNVTVDLTNRSIPATGASGTFTVTAPGNCLWAVAADSDWITVTTKRGSGTGASSYTVQANGSTTSRVGSISIIGEQRRVVHFTQAGGTQVVVSDDVPDTHPFYKEIAFLLKNNGLADFCEAGRFCPDSTTTRGTMAQFIVRSLYGSDSFTYPAAPYFTDVPNTHPLFKYIQVMRQLEITAGCTATSYCPDLPVTRGQMAVFIVRALQSKNRVPQTAINEFAYTTGQQFSDVPSSHMFYPYIQRLKDLGITSGCSVTAYCPEDPNTRGQISVFLARGLFALWEGRQ